MRWAPLLVLLSACNTDLGEPNPIFVADEWADKGCQQHGGTCGGGLFGHCYDDTWRVDDSLMCGVGGYFLDSCCFPSDAGPEAAVAVDAEGSTGEAGLDAGDGQDGDAAGSDASGE